MRHHIIAEIRTAERAFIRQLLPSSTKCTLRFNAAATAYLTVKDSHPVVPQLMDDGVRATVWMVSVEENVRTARRLLEGPIGDISGEGPYGTVTIPVIDDFDWFTKVLGWPKPGSPLSAQTDEYARYSGPSDTRALTAIAQNATRLGLPWDVAPSPALGTAGTTELRMHPLADRIVPALNADRLQLVIERNPLTDRWNVEVREGNSYPRPLTPESGALASWKWQRVRPKFTRIIVGGAGQGVEREFTRVIDAARESDLARILEGFDDSRMAEAGADLTPYGQASLDDAGTKAGISASLRETSWFRFPTAYDIGTRVPIRVGAFETEDVITEIEITHTTGDGFRAEPKVGFNVSAPQQRLAQFVSGLASSVRSLERR